MIIMIPTVMASGNFSRVPFDKCGARSTHAQHAAYTKDNGRPLLFNCTHVEFSCN